MYVAKQDRGVTRIYDPTHDQNTVERLALMEELRAGMDTELVLHYQPKCRATDGVLGRRRGARPLAAPRPRADLPGRVPPGRRELRADRPDDDADPARGAAAGRALADQGLDVNLAVNMSPRHLADAHLPEQLAAMLESENLTGAVLTSR
jgi:predicted signal transduction protein with EAL and GGDEF domain